MDFRHLMQGCIIAFVGQDIPGNKMVCYVSPTCQADTVRGYVWTSSQCLIHMPEPHTALPGSYYTDKMGFKTLSKDDYGFDVINSIMFIFAVGVNKVLLLAFIYLKTKISKSIMGSY